MKDFKYYDTNTKIYSDDKKAWREENYRLDNEFWADVLEDLGLSSHPKADILIELAKEHSDGESRHYKYAEVLELCELLD